VASRNPALQDIGLVVSILVGVTTLAMVGKGHKRRSDEGHDCKTTDDCQPPFVCKDGKCVDVQAAL